MNKLTLVEKKIYVYNFINKFWCKINYYTPTESIEIDLDTSDVDSDYNYEYDN